MHAHTHIALTKTLKVKKLFKNIVPQVFDLLCGCAGFLAAGPCRDLPLCKASLCDTRGDGKIKQGS
jgi:hypothetical protein